MKALRVDTGGVRLAEVPQPGRNGEVLVRVLRSGICNTDLEIVRGYAGFEGTLGHEFVGEVESAPGAPELEGQRVVGEINAGCGHCQLCRAGDSRHCPARTVLGIVGRHDSKLEIVRERGVRTLKSDEVPASFDRAFDVTVEASGSPAGFETALR